MINNFNLKLQRLVIIIIENDYTINPKLKYVTQINPQTKPNLFQRLSLTLFSTLTHHTNHSLFQITKKPSQTLLHPLSPFLSPPLIPIDPPLSSTFAYTRLSRCPASVSGSRRKDTRTPAMCVYMYIYVNYCDGPWYRARASSRGTSNRVKFERARTTRFFFRARAPGRFLRPMRGYANCVIYRGEGLRGGGSCSFWESVCVVC